MTQKFTEDGLVMPVTAVSAGPCTVVQVKGEKDGYKAVQVGYGLDKKINKPMAGHLKGLENFRYLKEFRVDDTKAYERGKVFDVTSFKIGDVVEVTATSKGKGFQGVVKRHGFHGSPATHGHKDQLRMPGSIGSTDPARVFKGTRMGGRMGGDTVTVKNLEIIEVDTANNILYIKGAVPGARGSFVEILSPGELSFVEKNVVSEKVKEVKTEEKVEDKVEETPVAPEETVEKTEDKAPAEEAKAEGPEQSRGKEKK